MYAFLCMFVPSFVRILMFGGIMLINKIVGIENRLVTLFDSETEQPLEEKRVAGYTNEFLSSSLRILYTSAEYVARRWFLRVFGKKKL